MLCLLLYFIIASITTLSNIISIFRKPSHYIYVYDTTYLSENSVPISPISSPLHPPLKTSITNARKSSDVRSGSLSEDKGISTISDKYYC